MNFLTRLKLRLATDSEVEYKKRLRKKQAKELKIGEKARKIARKEGETDHDRSDGRYRYDYTDGDLTISFKKDKCLSTSLTYNIYYEGECVFYKYGGSIEKFKPCGWIDDVIAESEKIKKEKREKEKQRKKEKWGLDRECDSEIFNSLYEV